MSKKHKKKCWNLNCLEHFLLFISAVSGLCFDTAFASLIGVLIGISSSAIGLKKYELIIKKKRKKHDKIVLLAKTKLNTSKF